LSADKVLIFRSPNRPWLVVADAKRQIALLANDLVRRPRCHQGADRALGAFLGVVKSNRSSSVEGVVSNLTNATGTSGRQHSTNTPRHGYTVRPVPTVQTITSLENCRFP